MLAFPKVECFGGLVFQFDVVAQTRFLSNDTFLPGVTQDYSLPTAHQHIIAYFLFNHIFLAHVGHRAGCYL